MVWVHDTVFRRHNAIHTQNSITRHTYCMWKRAGTIIAYNHWYFKFDNLQRCRDKKKDINISSCVFAVPPPRYLYFQKIILHPGPPQLSQLSHKAIHVKQSHAHTYEKVVPHCPFFLLQFDCPYREHNHH